MLLLLVATLACEQSRTEGPRARGPAGAVARLHCDATELARLMRRGYVPRRSPDVLLVPREPNYIGTASRPVHTGPWDYLVKVPLVFYGPGVVRPRGPLEGHASLADIAPTVAAAIGFDAGSVWDGEVLEDAADILQTPRVVVVVVLDGVGRDVVDAHPDAAPFLQRMARRGIDYTSADVGSSPSNTPPIHTTIGTGTFPARHGVPHVQIRIGTRFVDPFEGNNAHAVRVPTLADRYDAALGNRPLVGLAATVNWHLGLIGHGSAHPGGDQDEIVLLNDAGEQYGDTALYASPPVADPGLLERVTGELDAEDGARDGRWMGEDLTDPALRYMSPSFVRYEQAMLERLLARGYGDDGVTDLVFVNMKAADTAGHQWGMTSREVGELVEAEDAALADTAAFLDDRVGRGRWMMVVTADHGQTPYPEESGAWPIRGSELKGDLQDEFGSRSIQRVTSAGVFLSDASRAEEIARWIGDYEVGDNVVAGEEAPSAWKARLQEPLFDMVLAEDRVVVDRCR